MIKCSVGIIIHNEAQNIRQLLESLVAQKLEETLIEEIIVVSSASTDGSDDIVRSFIKENHRSNIKLITQELRAGKSSAINLFMENACSDVLVVESGDTLPVENTVELLVKPFSDKKVGMTGGRPIPINKNDHFLGFAVHLLWELHHRLALIKPKLGEMVAYRKIFDSIPGNSAVDEASIEAEIAKRGFEIRYIPEALIFNKGPDKLGDFIKQRRRIYSGHLWLKKNCNYEVASLMKMELAKLFVSSLKKQKRLKFFFFFLLAVLLESYSRILGLWDFYIRKKNPFIWEIAHSTKNLKRDDYA